MLLPMSNLILQRRGCSLLLLYSFCQSSFSSSLDSNSFSDCCAKARSLTKSLTKVDRSVILDAKSIIRRYIMRARHGRITAIVLITKLAMKISPTNGFFMNSIPYVPPQHPSDLAAQPDLQYTLYQSPKPRYPALKRLSHNRTFCKT